MATTDNSLFPGLNWNRFNADFRLPESSDAVRVASEVKVSVDSWIQSSLAKLEADMNARASSAVSQIDSQIARTKAELAVMTTHLDEVARQVNALVPADPELPAKLAALQTSANAARTAVAASAVAWEKHGADAVATVKSIVGTMATIAL
jgi:hypothetical protein